MNAIANITLRIPKDLRDWLTEQAAKNERSLNSELIFLVRMEAQRGARKKTPLNGG